MAGRLKIGAVEFEVHPVPEMTVTAVMRDPLFAKEADRDLWSWNGTEGRMLAQATDKGAIPLPNALIFFVSKASSNGVLNRNEAATRNMASRFITATGADDINQVLAGVSRLVNLPHKTLPLESFAPLQEATSYVVRHHLDFSVVLLRNRTEDLAGYLCLPNRVLFHSEIRAIHDQDALDRIFEADPRLRTMQPTFFVPSRSDANRGVRRTALAQRISESRQALAALPQGPGGDVARKNLSAKLRVFQAEWDALGK
ncbi:hypothetical protein [Pelagovum pacificum]|uniref:Uncharacterized protein n=1 Tax=Pelagovum pacificum TaxID=2588711 RepID=A0A5C5GHK5_9RHOB|nr:hypothetical protein [Pelagovum pacificum]QQA42666.1 hypothetical protein I8N54_18125 [Pelagovum pacificum]TNY34183.1 hypothetical protein FHY64_13265 [Pelagovum pacificum]